MDAATLAAVMGAVRGVDYAGLVGPFNDAMIAARCTTVNRAAMWCAQLGHESVGLKYREEIASGSAYNGRRDLGNIHPGDGPRYKGRGPIQLTGRANYGAFSRWAHGKGYVPSPTYFVDNPALVGQPRWGFLAASWYWTVARARLNDQADAGDIVGATKSINGGTNGLADRTARWRRALTFGDRLLPIRPQEESMADVPQDQWNKVLRAETEALEFTQHHGATKDNQFGHTLSIRKEVAELRAVVRQLQDDVRKLIEALKNAQGGQ